MRIAGQRFANALLLLAAAVVLSFVAFCMLTGRFRLDDSFMFIRYANNLMEHGNFGWNAGERTYGCTSIPYALFIWLIKYLNSALGAALSDSNILILSSFAWGCAAALLLHRVLLMTASEGRALDRSGIRLVMASILISPMFFVSLVTGMDATLSLFSNTLLIYLMLSYTEARTGRLLLLSAISAYLTFLVRPDNGFYALLFPGLIMISRGLPGKDILRFYLLLGLMFSLDLAAKYLYFGSPLPLPFYAKATGLYSNYLEYNTWNPFSYLFLFLLSTAALPAIAALRLNREAARTLVAFLIPMALTFLVFFKTVQIMGYFARYYVPSLPFMVCAGAFALRNAEGLAISREGVRNILILSMFFITLHTAAFIYDRETRLSDIRGLRRIEAMYYSSQYDCKSTRRGSDILVFSSLLDAFPFVRTVALSEYGYIGAAHPDIQIIDLVGLHNAAIARNGLTEGALKEPWPEIIWLHWAYGKLNKDLRALDAWSQYTYLPVFNGGMAIRNDSLLLAPGYRQRLMDILDCREISSGLSAPAFYR